MREQVKIIAEAGVNHNGDVNLAKKLIDVADESGADYVKFQTWVTEELIDLNAPKAEYQRKNDGDSSQFEMCKRLELSFDDFRALKEYCDGKRITFLSTPDEQISLDFLVDDLGLDIIKVGSGEITNLLYLAQIAKKKKDVILSTGMSNLSEIERALEVLWSEGAASVKLLHCTSDYPADFDGVNLNAMNTMKEAFKVDVGYSDHTIGYEVSVAAVALGASIIEKHFTLDRSMEGPDHRASLEPLELKEFVEKIRNVEVALTGSGRKVPTPAEIETKKIVMKGIYLDRDIKAGSILHERDLCFKRPVVQLGADRFKDFVGKKMTKDMKKGEALLLHNFVE